MDIGEDIQVLPYEQNEPGRAADFGLLISPTSKS
jgi:hypothetical protein